VFEWAREKAYDCSMAEMLSLHQVAEQIGCSYWSAWKAASKGRLPGAIQPLGKGSRWVVPPTFLFYLGQADGLRLHSGGMPDMSASARDLAHNGAGVHHGNDDF
jgi:hypothetical protein